MSPPLLAVLVEESTQRSVLEHVLRREGFGVTAHDEESSLVAAARARVLDGILLEASLPGRPGSTLPHWLHALHPRTPLLLLGGRGAVGPGSGTLWDRPSTHPAPLDPGPKLVLAVRRALEASMLERRVRSLERATGGPSWGGLVGRSPGWRTLVDDLDRIAATETTVLIRGEPGVGKEHVARALHAHSGRRDEPFHRLDGSRLRAGREPVERGWEPSVPEGGRKALSAPAGGVRSGTLFLTGVHALLPDGLKGLVEGTGEGGAAPGDGASVPPGYRLVVAGGASGESTRAGRFPGEPLDRLGGVEVRVPPLRERRGDIPLLVEHFASLEAPGRPSPSISKEAMDRLFAYPWPGNVAELRRAVRRALATCGTEIRAEDLPEPIVQGRAGAVTASGDPDPFPPDTLELRALERWAIRRAVAACRGNLSEAATRLGIGRTTLYRKMDAYGLR